MSNTQQNVNLRDKTGKLVELMSQADAFLPSFSLPVAPNVDILTSAVDTIAALMSITVAWATMRSKDPNTKVGACVYDPVTGGIFLGYNGFPTGVPDRRDVWEQRDSSLPLSKYDLVRHAEENAIEKARNAHINLGGCVLLVTHFPCRACARSWILPSGIKQIFVNNWCDHFDPVSHMLLKTTGVKMVSQRTGEVICG